MSPIQLLLQFGTTLFLAKFAGALPTDVQYDSSNADTYDSSNFFTSFNFIDVSDPTHGFVQYQSQDAATASGLAKIDGNTVRLGVDNTTTVQGGRGSVRLESTATYTHGLFIGDFAHMPGSICGIWPAFWTYGDGWPGNGEIDIIENVNNANANQMTLHTSEGITMASQGTAENLEIQNADCGAGGGYQGCGLVSKDQTGYGDGFNQAGGGVYAMEWTSDSISIWHFSRADIPADITNGKPNPGGWPAPMGKFVPTSGNIDDHFQNHKITFDTTFCGDWAGQQWDQCKSITNVDTCEDYVASNGNAFTEAFWMINSVKVYKQA
jgi:Glycosyl hydrolases family 16